MGHNSLPIRTMSAERPWGGRGDEGGSCPRSKFNRGAAVGRARFGRLDDWTIDSGGDDIAGTQKNACRGSLSSAHTIPQHQVRAALSVRLWAGSRRRDGSERCRRVVVERSIVIAVVFGWGYHSAECSGSVQCRRPRLVLTCADSRLTSSSLVAGRCLRSLAFVSFRCGGAVAACTLHVSVSRKTMPVSSGEGEPKIPAGSGRVAVVVVRCGLKREGRGQVTALGGGWCVGWRWNAKGAGAGAGRNLALARGWGGAAVGGCAVALWVLSGRRWIGRGRRMGATRATHGTACGGATQQA